MTCQLTREDKFSTISRFSVRTGGGFRLKKTEKRGNKKDIIQSKADNCLITTDGSYKYFLEHFLSFFTYDCSGILDHNDLRSAPRQAFCHGHPSDVRGHAQWSL